MRALRRSTLFTAVLALAVLAAPAAAMAAYGSIALNPNTGHVGYSYREPSKRAAEQLALKKCGQGCRIELWVFDQCGAVVRRRADGVYVAGLGATKQAARKDARRRAQAPRAQLIAYVCSG